MEDLDFDDATYSVEDDKLRLYTDDRLDRDLYDRLYNAGFKKAHIQGNFFAVWTPGREDLCMELFGEINPEETTLIERAEAKAERYEALAAKRSQQANGYADAAREIGRRFEMGQPILVGHHSERSARRDQKRMDSAMQKSVECFNAIDYWNYKAEGTERHANQKANPRTRANRIKKLLASLRTRQRNITHAEEMATAWGLLDKMPEGQKKRDKVEMLAGDYRSGTETGTWSRLEKGELCHNEVAKNMAVSWEKSAKGIYQLRWINHLLGRLSYEYSEQGDTPLFDGDLTKVILQAFARTHGAEKPKAVQDGDNWTVTSVWTLPLHIGDGKETTRTADEWKVLMQSLGYTVEIKAPRKSTAPKKPPIINPTLEQAEALQKMWNDKATANYNGYDKNKTFNTEVKPMLQKDFTARRSGSYGPCETVELTVDGTALRYRRDRAENESVCRVRLFSSSDFHAPDSIVVITDKPQKALPVEGLS